MTIYGKRILRLTALVILAIYLMSLIGNISCDAESKHTREIPNVNTNAAKTTTETHWITIDTETARIIWKMLREEYSEIASAAILGNLNYESKLCPCRLENLTINESERLSAIVTKNRDKFIYSLYGYGLASWTGTTNLSRLWDFCEENGYEVDSIEGQVRFLMYDYPIVAEMSHKRMAYYDLDDIVTATEDFRQSYEKSVATESSQYGRSKSAKLIYASFCQDIYTIDRVSDAPMHYDIYLKVKELNKKI